MLVWVLAAGAAVCLAYFIIIVLYSGIGTTFAVIWLGFAAGLALTAVSLKCYEREPERVALWIPVSLVTLCASGLVILVVLQILMFGRITVIAESGLDYVVVLGAQVKADGPSNTLKLRLDKAAEYARQNPETTLILSGGQGENEPETEAQAMKEYLLEQGIEEERLLLEEYSANTVENLAYSRLLLEKDLAEKERARQNGHLPDRPYGSPGQQSGLSGQQSGSPEQQYGSPGSGNRLPGQPRVGILTSNFHLYRAGKIAEKQGMTDVCTIASESDRLLFFHFCFRDALAILKDRIMGNL